MGAKLAPSQLQAGPQVRFTAKRPQREQSEELPRDGERVQTCRKHESARVGRARHLSVLQVSSEV
jgi:hypothetical protein